jgi:hypothetical protein
MDRYLVHGGWALGMVKGGNEDSEGIQMAYADVKLVLQQAGTLVTHADQQFLTLLDDLGVHEEENPERGE